MALILIAGKVHEKGMAVLRARSGLVIEEMTDLGERSFLARLPEADGLLIRTALLPAEAVRRAQRLRIVSRHGVGYDNIPLAELTAHRIPVSVTGNATAIGVAEHALFLMFALAKQALAFDRAVRTGDWDRRNRFYMMELQDRALLIMGLGRIGRELAKRGAALGMRVMAHDPQLSAADMAALGVAFVPDWRAVLPDVDVISLHLPRSPATEGLIGARELAAMKPTAILVNTARGGLIDEIALAAALKAGRIGGAGIDVLDAEPPPADHPLLSCDNVILSPHVASLTGESAARMGIAAAENLLAGLDGRLDPSLVINREVLG